MIDHPMRAAGGIKQTTDRQRERGPREARLFRDLAASTSTKALSAVSRALELKIIAPTESEYFEVAAVPSFLLTLLLTRGRLMAAFATLAL